MSDRLTDERLRAMLSLKGWVETISTDGLRAMATELLAARAALKWFADPSNWSEEELSEGVYFSAEWKVGFDPREVARHALGRSA